MSDGGGMLPFATPAWPAISHTPSSNAVPMTPLSQLGMRRLVVSDFGARDAGAGTAVAVTSALGGPAHAEQDLAELVAQLVEVRVAQHLRRARARQVDRDLGDDPTRPRAHDDDLVG